MVTARHIPILISTSGLNNTVDPVRLNFDLKTGDTELAQAVNVDIDDTGRVSRRLGRTQKLSNASRDAYTWGDHCYFVSGITLYQMSKSYTLATIRSDLSAGERMSYYPIAGRLYYVNTKEKGYIHNDKDNTWAKGTYTVPGDTNRQFADPPNGHIVSWFGGRALIAKKNALFASEPSFYGVFDLLNGFRLIRDHITMVRPVTAGLWVGTTSQILFYRGAKWSELRREIKAEYGVFEGSDAVCAGEKVGTTGSVVLATSQYGLCLLGDDGSYSNLTYNKLSFPSGKRADAAVVGDRYIVLIYP